MVMRDEYHIDGRKILEGNAGRGEPVDPHRSRERAQALAPRGVREYVHPVELYEKCRMLDPGHGGVVMILAKGLDVRGGHGQRGELPRAARDTGRGSGGRTGRGSSSRRGGSPDPGCGTSHRAEGHAAALRPRVLARARVWLPRGGRSKKHPGEHETDRECGRASWLSHSRLTAFHASSLLCREGPAERCRKKARGRVRDDSVDADAGSNSGPHTS